MDRLAAARIADRSLRKGCSLFVEVELNGGTAAEGGDNVQLGPDLPGGRRM
jgi:hypothetical protein